jgi:hypothetical protein
MNDIIKCDHIKQFYSNNYSSNYSFTVVLFFFSDAFESTGSLTRILSAVKLITKKQMITLNVITLQ